MKSGLNPQELRRYARHLTLPEFGLEGQQKLKAASVLVIGAGGLGSPLGLYLAAAGVGRLGLVDFDRVDESNLQRQILFTQTDIGESKVFIAGRKLQELNPHLQIDCHEVRVDESNVRALVRDYDWIVDGTDNFGTRYLVNDACVLEKKVNIFGSIFRFEGQVSRFGDSDGPCYRCLYPEPPPPGQVPNCAEGGVLGILPGLVGTLQATETIKAIAEIGTPLTGRLLLLDALDMQVRELKISKDPECKLCGEHPTILEAIEMKEYCSSPPTPELHEGEWSVQMLQKAMGKTSFQLIDVREPFEWQMGHLPGALHIPMSTIPVRVDEVAADQDVVVYCKSGARSGKVVEWLRQQGKTNVYNLQGGVLAWSDQIDPTFPKY